MTTSVKKLLTFPNPVNEYAARSVAGMVVLLCIATLVVRTPWLLWPLALGFVARVASGPRFSPFGQLATKGHRAPTGFGETCPRPTQAVRANDRSDAVGGRAGRVLPGRADGVVGAGRDDHGGCDAQVGRGVLSRLRARGTAGSPSPTSPRISPIEA